MKMQRLFDIRCISFSCLNSNLSAAGANEIDRDDESTYSLLNRRSSSGGLLSPEVDMAGHSPSGKSGEASETDGFYMLKKDSQRRTTLSKVLTHDEAKICAVWMDKIENNHNVQLVITKVKRNIIYNCYFKSNCNCLITLI